NALLVPETENHVLLIESARYLTNQLRFTTTHRRKYDNRANGMNTWMLRHLRQFAQHDFLEYNARPYQRYAIDALLNLYDLSTNARVKTAAQDILDYTTTKFAVSSNRLRRVGPFRRRNDGGQLDADHGNLYDGGADPQTALFELWAGPQQYAQSS